MKLNKKLIALAIGTMTLATTAAPSFADSCGQWEPVRSNTSCIRNSWSTAKDQSLGDWITKTYYERKCVTKTNKVYTDKKTKTRTGGSCHTK